jgi:hypothetical protein
MKRTNRRAFPFVQQAGAFGSPIDHDAAPLAQVSQFLAKNEKVRDFWL